MPRNGSGTYTLPQGAFVSGSTISSVAMNSDLSDIATAITNSIAADGQTPISGSFKLGNGTASLPSYSFAANANDGMYHISAGVLGFALAGIKSVTFHAPSAANGSGLLGVGDAVLIPIGTIWDYGGSTAPTGWFLCGGQEVSRSTYVELFTVIGTTYGTGNGSSTFNVPDLRGRITVGKDDMSTGAASRVTSAGSGVDGGTLGAVGGNQLLQDHTHTGSTGGENATHTHSAPNLGAATNNGSGSVIAITSYVGGVNAGAQTGPNSNDHFHTFTTDASGAGSSQNMPPSIIVSKIIFAGHA